MLKLVASKAPRATCRSPFAMIPAMPPGDPEPVTTWQAYNDWGGYSLYHGAWGIVQLAIPRGVVRPSVPGTARAGRLLLDRVSVGVPGERLGLDVTYWTDIDLHERPELLLHHRSLVSLGHDEYWSSEMRRGALAARARRDEPRLSGCERRLPAHPAGRVAPRDGSSRGQLQGGLRGPLVRGRQRRGHVPVARGARAPAGERAARRAVPVQPVHA